MNVNPLAIEALTNNQRQLDADGCEVGVSRQALDELLAGYAALYHSAVLYEPYPVAWQQIKDGKWVECSEFVAKGWSNEVSEGCRPLYASPIPIPAPPSDWFSKVVAFFVEHDMLDASDEYSIDDVMSALADNYAPAPPSELEARCEVLEKVIRWAHDTLYEINPSNYDHDEVCRLNDASVEVILGLAVELGEKHGKSDAWWAERRAALANGGRADG